MSCFEDTKEALGLPNHKLHVAKDPEGSEPEHNQRDVIGLPGRQVNDPTCDLETLRKIKAHFQNVSCLLHECPACLWLSHASYCRGSQGLMECQLAPCHRKAGCARDSSSIESDETYITIVALCRHASAVLQMPKTGTAQVSCKQP